AIGGLYIALGTGELVAEAAVDFVQPVAGDGFILEGTDLNRPATGRGGCARWSGRAFGVATGRRGRGDRGRCRSVSRCRDEVGIVGSIGTALGRNRSIGDRRGWRRNAVAASLEEVLIGGKAFATGLAFLQVEAGIHQLGHMGVTAGGRTATHDDGDQAFVVANSRGRKVVTRRIGKAGLDAVITAPRGQQAIGVAIVATVIIPVVQTQIAIV